MKKYQFYLWLIALAGLITSCSQDETDALTAGESNRVSFTASLPADFARPGTRALPTPPTDFQAGQYKLRCILEVWSKDLSTLIVRKEEVPTAEATEIKFEFELANPADYKALFWADYITPSSTETSMTTPNNYTHYADDSYETNTNDGLKAVNIRNYPNNSLLRDAFFACKDFTKGVGALTDFKATLTRPLAKLTIAEKNATNFGYCRQVKVTQNLPKTLNVATGAVSGTTSKTYSAYYYSDGSGSYAGFGNDVTINSETCKTLFFTYIFAGDDDTMGEIKLEFTPADGNGKTLKSVTIPAGIPLKRNYCTNAAGSLINETVTPSANTEMTVDIKDTWETQDQEYDIPSTVWDGKYPANATAAGTIMATAMTTDGGTTAADYVFTIRTASQLAALSYLANQQDAGYIDDDTNKGKYTEAQYLLATDIDLNNHSWTPISGKPSCEFRGTFDGQGHTVSNMEVKAKPNGSSCYAGLFGRVGNVSLSTETIIRNLIVEGTVTANPDNARTSCYAGGICGNTSNATLQYCRFNGTVSAESDDNLNNCVGGLVGVLEEPSTVQACISNATVTRNGGDNDSGAGGLAGRSYNANNNNEIKCINSAWNSTLTTDGIGKFSYGSINNSNNSFTDISGLNALLSDMNNSVAESTYVWQADSGDTACPTLVLRTPAGN